MPDLAGLAAILDKTANAHRDMASVFEEYDLDEIARRMRRLADQVDRAAEAARQGLYAEEEHGDQEAQQG